MLGLGVVVPGGRLHTMTAFDAVLCLDYADEFSAKEGEPGRRGIPWEEAFRSKAAHLGYYWTPDVCRCPDGVTVHRAECGYVRPLSKRLAVPPSPAAEPAGPYRNPPGMHRHECDRCGYVWCHRNRLFGVPPDDHYCPGCGREVTDKYFGGRRPDEYTEGPSPGGGPSFQMTEPVETEDGEGVEVMVWVW